MLEFEDIDYLLSEIKRAIERCIEEEKYTEAAQLATSFGSIMAAMGKKGVEDLLMSHK